MKKSEEIKRKKDKVKELYELENQINKQIGQCESDISKATEQKKKLAKRVSYNMKRRNKIINELNNNYFYGKFTDK